MTRRDQPGKPEDRGKPPPLPRGSVECPSYGEVTAWEGEPPTDCPICGEVLLPWGRGL